MDDTINLIIKEQGQFAKIQDILKSFDGDANKKEALRQSIVRGANSGEIFRAGRGIYGFFRKTKYSPYTNETSKKIIEILKRNFAYLDYVITDAAFLADFMNLLPFVSTFVIETEEFAFDSILATLKKNALLAYDIKDFQKFDKYIKDTIYIILRSKLVSNPKIIRVGGIEYASIEKILVDLIADKAIFSQYQEIEIENIYKGIIEKYAVNYTKLLQYAKARNRKKECLELLELTDEYRQVRDLL